jgi:hypothetical protein
MSDLFPARLGHHLAPVRRPFDALQVLMALVDELIACDLIGHDVDDNGRFDLEQRKLWHRATTRIGGALFALDIPANSAVRKIKREVTLA